MKNTLRLLSLAATLALPLTLSAQNELSNFSATGRGGVINTFATDYQTIGINPANLGRVNDFRVALTVGEVGLGIGSQTLTRTTFKHLIYDSALPVGTAEKAELVKQLTGNNVLNVNTDITSVGLAITLPNGLGGFAFSNRQRLSAHLDLNQNAADIIVNGQNAAIMKQYYEPGVSNTPRPGTTPPNSATVLDGTNIQLAWTSEYNIAYGYQILDNTGFKLAGGLGYRYIQGIGIADVRVSDGNLYAYSAMSPIFQVKYGALANSPNFNLETGSGLHPVGSGHGFDVGLAAEVGKFVRLGVSLVEMGSMTWNGNVLQAKDQQLQQTSSTGITSYNVFEELGKQFNADQRNLFTYETAKERTAALPAKLRLGGGIHVSKLFEAGVDVTLPLNKVAGNITAPFVGFGVDYKPIHWLRLSSGFTGGAGYGKSLPLGATIVTPVWEAGISTRDVVGLLSETSPYSSVAFGVLRFKFGASSN